MLDESPGLGTNNDIDSDTVDVGDDVWDAVAVWRCVSVDVTVMLLVSVVDWPRVKEVGGVGERENVKG